MEIWNWSLLGVKGDPFYSIGMLLCSTLATRWASSLQGESAVQKMPSPGWPWWRRSWETTGPNQTCSALAPAPYLLTLRDSYSTMWLEGKDWYRVYSRRLSAWRMKKLSQFSSHMEKGRPPVHNRVECTVLSGLSICDFLRMVSAFSCSSVSTAVNDPRQISDPVNFPTVFPTRNNILDKYGLWLFTGFIQQICCSTWDANGLIPRLSRIIIDLTLVLEKLNRSATSTVQCSVVHYSSVQ